MNNFNIQVKEIMDNCLRNKSLDDTLRFAFILSIYPNERNEILNISDLCETLFEKKIYDYFANLDTFNPDLATISTILEIIGRSKTVGFNSNEILSDIDDLIYKQVIYSEFNNDKLTFNFLPILIYYYYRVTNCQNQDFHRKMLNQKILTLFSKKILEKLRSALIPTPKYWELFCTFFFLKKIADIDVAKLLIGSLFKEVFEQHKKMLAIKKNAHSKSSDIFSEWSILLNYINKDFDYNLNRDHTDLSNLFMVVNEVCNKSFRSANISLLTANILNRKKHLFKKKNIMNEQNFNDNDLDSIFEFLLLTSICSEFNIMSRSEV